MNLDKHVFAAITVFAALAIIVPLSSGAYAQTETNEKPAQKQPMSKLMMKKMLQEQREQLKTYAKDQKEKLKQSSQAQKDQIKGLGQNQMATIQAQEKQVIDLLSQLRTSIAGNTNATKILDQLEAKLKEIKTSHDSFKDMQDTMKSNMTAMKGMIKDDLKEKREAIKDMHDSMKDKIKENSESK